MPHYLLLAGNTYLPIYQVYTLESSMFSKTGVQNLLSIVNKLTSVPPTPTRAIEVFFSYAHEDEKLRDKLEKHLSILKRQGVITGWHDRRIGAGKEWAGEIDQHLNTAHIILLLISSNFLASDYCYDIELERAMKRHHAGEARVIPIILSSVDWEGAPFSKLQALPRDGRPVTKWRSHDDALKDVAQGIRAAVKELKQSQRYGLIAIAAVGISLTLLAGFGSYNIVANMQVNHQQDKIFQNQ